MDITRLREKAAQLFSGKKGAVMAAVLGGLGLLMILFPSGDNDEEMPVEAAAEPPPWSDYCTQTEQRLEALLSAIEGVGDVRVMITVSSTGEYIYANSEDADSGGTRLDPVIIRQDKNEEPVVKTVYAPRITGVVAVCEGGDSDSVREDVYRAVTAALGIPSSCVYVTAAE